MGEYPKVSRNHSSGPTDFGRVVAGIADPGPAYALFLDRDRRSRLQRGVHRHLRRLHRIWIDNPIYFVTTCTFRRRQFLTDPRIAAILVDEWRSAHERHAWAVGRYVIMPDHVHFFCAADLEAKALPEFMQAWKQWTSKRIRVELRATGPVWQAEFFDHVLRSGESYSQKWEYVRENPERAGLIDNADHWPWQGEIEELRL